MNIVLLSCFNLYLGKQTNRITNLSLYHKMSDNTTTNFNPHKSWTRDRTLQICKLLRENPVLWDTALEDYDNPKARERAVRTILMQLGPYMPGLTMKDIRKKIHNLRSQYRKRLLSDKMRQRQGRSRESMSWCLKELDFLEPFFLKQSKISKFSNNLRERVADVGSSAVLQYSVEDFQPVEELEAIIQDNVSIDDNDESLTKRFAWLGQEVDKTFKEVKNEKLKKSAMVAIQIELKNARTRDRQKHNSTTTTSDNNHYVPVELVNDMTDEEESELNDSLDNNENVNIKSYFEWNYDMSIYNHDEIHVKEYKNQVIISACHEEHEVTGLGNMKRNFERILELPNACNHNIEATLSLDGVLTVRAVERTLMDSVVERNVIIQKV